MTDHPVLNPESVQRRLVAIRERLDELGQIGDLTADRSAIVAASVRQAVDDYRGYVREIAAWLTRQTGTAQ